MKATPVLVKNIFSFFTFFCIVFIPFPFTFVSFQLELTDFVFGKLIGIISQHLFTIKLANTKVYSDSVSMYILVLLLILLAIMVSLLLSRNKKWKQYQFAFMMLCYHIGCYYLAMQLLKYGMGKIVKEQFYLPEPNTLYTPLGQVSKDLLYWSSMGTSHLYNVFAGSIEALAALLLLFKRTRLLGLLLALVSLLQIVAINFSFDISVKLYSLFLLFLCLYLLAPYRVRLYYFFWLHKNAPEKEDTYKLILSRHPFVTVFIKSFILGLIFLEVVYPFFRTKKFNDDLAARPYLHGAYEVKQVITGADTLEASFFPVKRFFIHRNGYMIFQSPDEELQDFKLTYDRQQQQLILQDYQLKTTRIKYTYHAADSILVLQYSNNNKQYEVTGKGLNWRQLPALQKGFHWTVDPIE